MNILLKASVQGAAGGLMLAAVLLLDGHLSQPAVLRAQTQGLPITDIVRSRRFEVVDDKGKLRAFLGEGPNGSLGLTFCDTNGKTQASLRVFSIFTDGSVATPELAMFDPAGRQRISINVSKVTAVQNRQKSSDPCCKRELCVPETGILRLRSTSVS